MKKIKCENTVKMFVECSKTSVCETYSNIKADKT